LIMWLFIVLTDVKQRKIIGLPNIYCCQCLACNRHKNYNQIRHFHVDSSQLASPIIRPKSARHGIGHRLLYIDFSSWVAGCIMEALSATEDTVQVRTLTVKRANNRSYTVQRRLYNQRGL